MESSQTSEDQLENLSNLLINTNAAGGSSGGEVALIEQYEYEMDKALNEHLLNEKEQMNQRLFQSFQTSACTVAQMFKDKSTAGAQQQQQSQFSSWQSFQNSAGAITVLYKGSYYFNHIILNSQYILWTLNHNIIDFKVGLSFCFGWSLYEV